MSNKRSLNDAKLRAQVPHSMKWSIQDVAGWVEKIGYGEYKVNE